MTPSRGGRDLFSDFEATRSKISCPMPSQLSADMGRTGVTAGLCLSHSRTTFTSWSPQTSAHSCGHFSGIVFGLSRHPSNRFSFSFLFLTRDPSCHGCCHISACHAWPVCSFAQSQCHFEPALLSLLELVSTFGIFS